MNRAATNRVEPLPGLVAGTWNIDTQHSEIVFTVRHLMSTVRGSFTDFSGEFDIAGDLYSSKAHAEISTASVDTREPDRDAHVRSADFLDVENHPTMFFATTGVSPAKTGRRAKEPRYYLDGTLTVRGVTKPVRLLTEFHGVRGDQYGGLRAGFTSTTVINRFDYGVAWNLPVQGDKLLLGEEVTIQLEIQAVLSEDGG
jgi:polyisoprenoid-binding protein YceI